MKHKDFLAALDQKAIVEAIAAAEKKCSGEIRVHIQPRSTGAEIRTVAERTFERLGMTKTELRNGVMLFIASEQHQFVILGDRGIDEKVGHDFWDHIAADLTSAFKAGDFNTGIIKAITQAGDALETYFPYERHDVDELPNEISIHHE